MFADLKKMYIQQKLGVVQIHTSISQFSNHPNVKLIKLCLTSLKWISGKLGKTFHMLPKLAAPAHQLLSE